MRTTSPGSSSSCSTARPVAGLLDSYDSERRPIAESNADFSLGNQRRFVQTDDRIALGQSPTRSTSGFATPTTIFTARASRSASATSRARWCRTAPRASRCNRAGTSPRTGPAAASRTAGSTWRARNPRWTGSTAISCSSPGRRRSPGSRRRAPSRRRPVVPSADAAARHGARARRARHGPARRGAGAARRARRMAHAVDPADPVAELGGAMNSILAHTSAVH